MTDAELQKYLKPRTHYGAMVTVALAVAGAVWGVTQYLGDIPKRPEFNETAKNVTQLRLDQETMKGDVKAINIRIDEGFKSMSGKLDEIGSRQRHR